MTKKRSRSPRARKWTSTCPLRSWTNSWSLSLCCRIHAGRIFSIWTLLRCVCMVVYSVEFFLFVVFPFLTHVCLRQKRNKPKEPPKVPKAAPFFIPTVPGLVPQFALPDKSSEEQVNSCPLAFHICFLAPKLKHSGGRLGVCVYYIKIPYTISYEMKEDHCVLFTTDHVTSTPTGSRCTESLHICEKFNFPLPCNAIRHLVTNVHRLYFVSGDDDLTF